MGDLCAEYFDLAAIGFPQERGNLFGKVGSAVHHRQQDTVYLELGVDLPLYLVYRGEQLFQSFGGQILCLNGIMILFAAASALTVSIPNEG